MEEVYWISLLRPNARGSISRLGLRAGNRSTIDAATRTDNLRQDLFKMLSTNKIVALHDDRIRAGEWGEGGEILPEDAGLDSDWLAAVARQHRANFDLWHIEDEARAIGA